LSHLVPAFIDFTQVGLEESDVSLRVTAAHSCPTFPGLLAPVQHLPGGSLRVTSRPKPPPPTRCSLREARPRGVAHGIPAADDVPRLESPADPSRDADVPCADVAQHCTPASSFAGALQRVDEGDTTSGTTSIASVRTRSRLPFQKVSSTRRSARRWAARANGGGGSILTSRSGSVLASA
jgi:hypothetical protein